MSQSSEMKIKETKIPPMSTYEIRSTTKLKGKRKKISHQLLLVYNTLQMANGKFYEIKGRNIVFESIYWEM